MAMNPFNVKLYKSVEVAPEEDEAVKKTDTVDSVQLSDLTENLRYVLQLGLNVDTKVDQNEYSEVDQSIRQFLGTPDPNIIKDMNNDHLFRRVFSNLVTGRFPSSFRVRKELTLFNLRAHLRFLIVCNLIYSLGICWPYISA